MWFAPLLVKNMIMCKMCKIFHIRPLGRITRDPADGAGTMRLGKSDHGTPHCGTLTLNTFERVQSHPHLTCALQTLDLEDTWPLILAPILRSFLLCPFLIQGPGLCSSCSDWCPWHGLKWPMAWLTNQALASSSRANYFPVLPRGR